MTTHLFQVSPAPTASEQAVRVDDIVQLLASRNSASILARDVSFNTIYWNMLYAFNWLPDICTHAKQLQWTLFWSCQSARISLSNCPLQQLQQSDVKTGLMLRAHGMPTQALYSVYRATALAKLLSCNQAWSGLCIAAPRNRIDSRINRSKRSYLAPPWQFQL